MFPPGRLLFPFEFELLTPLTCACPPLTFPGRRERGSAVFIDGYTISDALPTTHNEMGLPVDVLSEKREMQV